MCRALSLTLSCALPRFPPQGRKGLEHRPQLAVRHGIPGQHILHLAVSERAVQAKHVQFVSGVTWLLSGSRLCCGTSYPSCVPSLLLLVSCVAGAFASGLEVGGACRITLGSQQVQRLHPLLQEEGGKALAAPPFSPAPPVFTSRPPPVFAPHPILAHPPDPAPS